MRRVADPPGTPVRGFRFGRVAAFKSEPWPASFRNGGRHQIGMPGRNASEFALGRRGGGASSARARQGPLRLRYDGKSKVTGRKGKNSFAYGYIRNMLAPAAVTCRLAAGPRPIPPPAQTRPTCKRGRASGTSADASCQEFFAASSSAAAITR